ncbi:hypothetical protein ACFUNF_09335 [Streptomyces sp. NPDC057291]|uniref:hypothetical protein n=1 Tax=Streptomyces sp. NPDC057291 TaxID=3346087 RepID=UPI00363C9A61
MMIVHDRTKTVGRRHVALEGVVLLHPEAVAFVGNVDHLAVNAPPPAPLWRPVRQQRLYPRPLRVSHNDPVIGKNCPSGYPAAADWVGPPELPHYEGRSICALSPSHLDMIDSAAPTRP